MNAAHAYARRRLGFHVGQMPAAGSGGDQTNVTPTSGPLGQPDYSPAGGLAGDLSSLLGGSTSTTAPTAGQVAQSAMAQSATPGFPAPAPVVIPSKIVPAPAPTPQPLGIVEFLQSEGPLGVPYWLWGALSIAAVWVGWSILAAPALAVSAKRGKHDPVYSKEEGWLWPDRPATAEESAGLEEHAAGNLARYGNASIDFGNTFSRLPSSR